MNGGHGHYQVTIPYHVNWSVKSWRDSVRLTMVNHESEFKYQLKELHRIYRKQVELTEEVEGKVTKLSQVQLKYTRKRSTKLKLDLDQKMVIFNDDMASSHDADAPATPETINSSMVRGKQVLREDVHAKSAAEALVAMSSSLLRASSDRLLSFAKIVTSVKCYAGLASRQRRTRLAQKPGQHGKQRAQEMQMPGQHGKMAKKRHVEPCISSWGKIKNGRRSKRVRDSNPLYTFRRGAFLCRWR
ncbi:hypothetical protein L1887_20690 [Cichorium endivia]|nr:hypothetical protein L1887_20690 [Cichorium endivia]